MRLGRFDSLFARLILAQASLLLLVALLVAIWLTAARADACAVPYAAMWAPDLARAAASPPDVNLAPAASGLTLERSISRPSGFLSPNIFRGPGTVRLTSELKARGVYVDEVRLDWNGGQPLMWFHMLAPSAAPVWLGVRLPPILPSITVYTVSLSLLTVGLVTFISWRFARRFTRPLEELRSRMVGDESHLVEATHSSAWASTASSEVVAIDAAYRQLIERLHHIESERVTLLAGVSHDLRSPLGRIRLAAELLPVTSETQMDVSTITRNVDHADRLIGSFLAYLSTGSLELGEAVDVATIAASVVARFDPISENLILQVDRPGAAVLPRSNTLLIDRLIFNLIDNALKHGRTPVRVRLSTDDVSIQVDVCDAGPGLPEGQEQTLLQAFARGDVGRATPGLGLGLSVVTQTTARLRGQFGFVRDADGHHARVTLPLA